MVKLQIAGRNEWVELSPSKIIALGLNYRDHIEESHSVNVQGFTKETPSEPVLFPKTPNTLIGPEETIRIPAFLQKYGFDAGLHNCIYGTSEFGIRAEGS